MTSATYAVSRFSVSSDVVAGHWARISLRSWVTKRYPQHAECGVLHAATFGLAAG